MLSLAEEGRRFKQGQFISGKYFPRVWLRSNRWIVQTAGQPAAGPSRFVARGGLISSKVRCDIVSVALRLSKLIKLPYHLRSGRDREQA